MKYFVSYGFQRANQTEFGFGYIFVNTKLPLTTTERVKELQNHIEGTIDEDFKTINSKVVILNWKLLDE